jgi:hypothetical protein
MFVSCDKCGYDSGDQESADELAQKVNADGGRMVRVRTKFKDVTRGYIAWDITCPKGHKGDEIHLD